MILWPCWLPASATTWLPRPRSGFCHGGFCAGSPGHPSNPARLSAWAKSQMRSRLWGAPQSAAEIQHHCASYLPQQPLSEAGRAVLKRFSTSRFLCSFDFDGHMGLHEIPHNAVVIPQDRLADFIGDPAGAPRATLGDILEAIARCVNTLN